MRAFFPVLSTILTFSAQSSLAFIPRHLPAGTTTLAATHIARKSAPLMLFSRMFGAAAADPSTNLAKEPALSKRKSEDEWKQVLTTTQFKVLRRKATEPRKINIAKGGWDDHFEKGTYVCSGCKTPLYTSEHKFDCGCGWPGFWTNIKDRVYEQRDSDGFRCEILCAECGGHLGHVFRGEGFGNPAPNERHCVNSVSVAFVPEGKTEVQPCTYEGPVYE